MKHDIDTLLKQALSPIEEPDEELKRKILRQVKEKNVMSRKRKWVPATLVAALVLTFGSITTFAAIKYLTPNQAAERTDGDVLAQAFTGEDAININQTQTYGDFSITLLGIVSGKNLSPCIEEDNGVILEQNKTYTVVAIERTDGTPMPDTSSDDYGNDSFLVSPLIQGYDPCWYNIMTMGGGYGEFVQDGIQYRVTECDNVEIFANQCVYLCVSEGTFYDQNAYCFDEVSGMITRNEAYTGVNALFTLPLDKEKADPAAAAAYIEEMEQNINGESSTNSEDSVEQMADGLVEDEVTTFMEKLTPENISEYANRLEETVVTVTPDADGDFSVHYELEDGAGADITTDVNSVFGTMSEGMAPGFGYSSDGTVEGLLIDTFTLNADGTVTYAVYSPK